MKIVIDIPDGYNLSDIQNGSIACGRILKAVKNGKPYEERQISHEQECIIEELENICINNEYALDLLGKLKSEERPQDNLISSLTELCNRYCGDCSVPNNSNDCTDCMCTHIKGIIGEQAENE